MPEFKYPDAVSSANIPTRRFSRDKHFEQAADFAPEQDEIIVGRAAKTTVFCVIYYKVSRAIEKTKRQQQPVLQ